MRELALHLMDIIQNSLSAGARRIDILIAVDPQEDRLTIAVRDDGCGMSAEMLRQARDPYATTRTTRAVGLGLALLNEQCALTGGRLSLQSAPGEGTLVEAVFGLSSIDRLPLGNVSETMTLLILADPAIDYNLTCRSPEGDAVFDLAEIRKQLEDVPVNDPLVLDWITGYLRQQMTLFGGALHEITH
ncbi:MAG: ATP-binding protein [Bacillota bacterium]|nr:ATP-binding protein [Bacillota bacterium]